MADNNRNRRGQQEGRGQMQNDQRSIGNQQQTTQTGAQNNGGRNRKSNIDMHERGRQQRGRQGGNP